MSQSITKWLERAHPIWFISYATTAGFITYFCMYAFRKPFTAASYDCLDDWSYGIDFKIIALIAQITGYALSKFIGIKVVSEMDARWRAYAIIGLIVFAEIALIFFALVPNEFKLVALFFNGLPLGMVWGLVFAYLEGRRTTEILGAGLCVSFIVSSGVVKTIGVSLMLYVNVTEFWMPAITGALFLPLLFVSVYGLTLIPVPTRMDQQARTKRSPMTANSRQKFLNENLFGVGCLVLIYVLFTALRDFRDNFAVELWGAIGFEAAPSVFTISEIIVALIVLVMLGATILIKNNRRAFQVYHYIIMIGAIVTAISTYLFMAGYMQPFVWMVLTGIGLYTVYVPFNCILFDRMIAALRSGGNAGFMIYVADALGYVGSLILLLYKNFGAPDISWVNFFANFIYIASTITLIAAGFSWRYFNQKIPHDV